MEDASRAVDGRIQKVSLDIRHIEVERACGVNNSLKGRIRDNRLVEGTSLRDVRDNGEIEPFKS